MLINNAFSEDDAAAFDRRARDAAGGQELEYCAEPKFDGLAISLRYETACWGSDTRTRDGGEVTANVRTIRSIPLRLSRNPRARWKCAAKS
jgi:DNA ligase (NAD+)